MNSTTTEYVEVRVESARQIEERLNAAVQGLQGHRCPLHAGIPDGRLGRGPGPAQSPPAAAEVT